MGTAYDRINKVFQSLVKVEAAFREAKSQLSALPNTQAMSSFSQFSDFTVGGTSDTGTSWEIEISAVRDGAEARWQLEIELMHSSESCELSAEAGFLGKYGPMPLREIAPIALTDVDDLGAHLDGLTKELLQELDRDCIGAVEAERKEALSSASAHGNSSSEQGADDQAAAAVK